MADKSEEQGGRGSERRVHVAGEHLPCCLWWRLPLIPPPRMVLGETSGRGKYEEAKCPKNLDLDGTNLDVLVWRLVQVRLQVVEGVLRAATEHSNAESLVRTASSSKGRGDKRGQLPHRNQSPTAVLCCHATRTCAT